MGPRKKKKHSPGCATAYIPSVKRLKNGKACGEDKILNEMIKAFSETHMGVLTKIFNIVLQSGHMPHEWVIGIIKPIYKNKGDIIDQITTEGLPFLAVLENCLPQY